MNSQLLVATRKGLFTLERNAGWQITRTHFLGDPVSVVLPDRRTGTVFAALNLGHFGVKLHRSRDGGVRWEEIATPAYPPQPEGAEGPAWSLDQIWCMEAGGDDQPGLIWAGTIPGGLFRSDDEGDSWTLVRSLWDRPERLQWFGGGYDAPGIHSISVDPRDSRRLTIAISCGGVWRSEDAGETWALCGDGMHASYMPPERSADPNIQDPHRLVQCTAHPETFWVQHHDGIFRSVDGARNWQAIAPVAPSGFGFTVVVHPREPDTAWFVPAAKDECRVAVDGALAVNRTRDGGSSFETLRAGLPQEHAYDLIYRHGLDVDTTGETLAMGSTTGGLWISGDQGDHWESINNHLPPVYCVRFT
ncbi:MAG: hypothetical protein WED00_06500 [Aquisalimonadaceae bacterium]